jgi:hypothetical protein
MANFVFTTYITIDAENYDEACSWFDYQMKQTQLKDIYVPEIEEVA